MRFCTHCGAQIPDNAKFCTACGTPISAPDEASVTISDPEETIVEAAGEEGEFVAATWQAPQKPAQPARKAPPLQQQPPVNQAPPPPAAEPIQPVQPVTRSAKKKKGFFHYLWLYLKIIILVVVLVMAAVFIKGVIEGYTSTTSSSRAPSGLSAPKGSIKADDNDLFQSLDDMPLHERAEYMESMVDRAYEEIAREERKGDRADEARILELGQLIEELRSKLDQLAQ